MILGILTSTPAEAVVFPDRIASKAEASFVVSVFLNEQPGIWDPQGPICTGSLLTSQIVMTAAHCVHGQRAEQMLVASGGVAAQNEPILVQVVRVQAHERYLDDKTDSLLGVNDIALLLLATPVSGGFVTLPDSQVMLSATKAKWRLFGYGLNQNNEMANEPRMATLTNQSAKAAQVYRSFNTKTQLAAGSYRPSEKVYAGSCSGDSGGPLVYSKGKINYQIGITSYGVEGCDTRYPSVFMRVASYTSWIKQNMKSIVENALSKGNDFAALDSRRDTTDAGAAGDITRLDARISAAKLEILVTYVARFSNTDHFFTLGIDFDGDGNPDITNSTVEDTMVDVFNHPICSASLTGGGGNLALWTLAPGCLSGHTIFDVYASVQEKSRPGFVSVDGLDTAVLETIFIYTPPVKAAPGTVGVPQKPQPTGPKPATPTLTLSSSGGVTRVAMTQTSGAVRYDVVCTDSAGLNVSFSSTNSTQDIALTVGVTYNCMGQVRTSGAVSNWSTMRTITVQ